MKIALLGYGKMGKVIERIALERGHEIVLKKDHIWKFADLPRSIIPAKNPAKSMFWAPIDAGRMVFANVSPGNAYSARRASTMEGRIR